MECILCHLLFAAVSELKMHYVDFHDVDQSNCYFLDLFQPDTIDRKCKKCGLMLNSNRMKKNHMFLYHYNQAGGARNRLNNDLPLNVLRREQIMYYSINFDQHKNYYNFFSTDMIDIFLDTVYDVFKPRQNLLYKFHRYFEIINQQNEPEQRTEKRVCLTNVFRFNYFNQFVRGEIKDEIVKRVIINGQAGSSWYFKRFNRLNIIVAPLVNELKLISV